MRKSTTATPGKLTGARLYTSTDLAYSWCGFKDCNFMTSLSQTMGSGKPAHTSSHLVKMLLSARLNVLGPRNANNDDLELLSSLSAIVQGGCRVHRGTCNENVDLRRKRFKETNFAWGDFIRP